MRGSEIDIVQVITKETRQIVSYKKRLQGTCQIVSYMGYGERGLEEKETRQSDVSA